VIFLQDVETVEYHCYIRQNRCLGGREVNALACCDEGPSFKSHILPGFLCLLLRVVVIDFYGTRTPFYH